MVPGSTRPWCLFPDPSEESVMAGLTGNNTKGSAPKFAPTEQLPELPHDGCDDSDNIPVLPLHLYGLSIIINTSVEFTLSDHM